MANCRFAIIRCPEWDWVAQVVFRAEMAFRTEMELDLVSNVCIGLVEEHPYSYTSSMSGNSSLGNFAKEDCHPCSSDES
jgi:hypothetical protein